MKRIKVLDNLDKGPFSTLWSIASKGFDETKSYASVIPYENWNTKYVCEDEDGALASRLWSWTTDQLKQSGSLS